LVNLNIQGLSLHKKLLFITIVSSFFIQLFAYDIDSIRADFQTELHLEPKEQKLSKGYYKKIKKHLHKSAKLFTHTQFVTLVDLSKQILILNIWDYEKKDFYLVGFTHISSGDINREIQTKPGEDHYVKTPAGVFDIKSGWRSDGKLNDAKTAKPYGSKDKFVFFFGTQESVRYNTFDKNGTKIKDKKKWVLIKDNLELAMHAHTGVENFGYPQSHGCIRMSEELNSFLDNNFVFFSHLLDGKRWTHPYEKAPKRPKNHDLAGKYLIIIDSAS
jgi:hypothetical protein